MRRCLLLIAIQGCLAIPTATAQEPVHWVDRTLVTHQDEDGWIVDSEGTSSVEATLLATLAWTAAGKSMRISPSDSAYRQVCKHLYALAEEETAEPAPSRQLAIRAMAHGEICLASNYRIFRARMTKDLGRLKERLEPGPGESSQSPSTLAWLALAMRTAAEVKPRHQDISPESLDRIHELLRTHLDALPDDDASHAARLVARITTDPVAALQDDETFALAHAIQVGELSDPLPLVFASDLAALDERWAAWSRSVTKAARKSCSSNSVEDLVRRVLLDQISKHECRVIRPPIRLLIRLEDVDGDPVDAHALGLEVESDRYSAMSGLPVSFHRGASDPEGYLVLDPAPVGKVTLRIPIGWDPAWTTPNTVFATLGEVQVGRGELEPAVTFTFDPQAQPRARTPRR